MKRYTFIVITFILFGALQAISQPMNRSTPQVLEKIAEERFDSMDYFNSLEYYEKLYEEDKKNVEVNFKIAELQYILRDYNKASSKYAAAFRRDKNNEYFEHKFNYARALKMNEQYEDAMLQFSEYINGTQDPIKKMLAEAELKGCQMAPKMTMNERLKIENAGKTINKATTEASPFISPDGKELYYASLNSDSAVTLNGKEGDYFLKIYLSKRDGDKWSQGTPITAQVNREDFHNGNACFSRDGRRMYFTRALISGNVTTESKIYVATYTGDGWGAATEVAGINGAFISKHPTMGELFGKEVIFFSSNMPGGIGGTDLYYATYKSESAFADPVNLGATINTVGDDETPFYKEGKLYYSTTGLPGLGGFDIFTSTWSGTGWSTPVNMGKGYNSSVDDLYYSVDKEGYNGFIVSNRPGGKSLKSKTCCDDIWFYTIEKFTAIANVSVYDAVSGKVVNGADVQLIDMTGGRMGMTDTKNSGKTNLVNFPLTLEKSYAIIVTKEGFYPDTITGINTVALAKSEVFNKKVNLKPKEPEFEIYSTEEPIRLNNIYYDFDDDKILKESEGDLTLINDLMDQYPDMVIELSSHTDARGDDDYNLKLSQRRANSAKNWLLARGVKAARINAVGYGETVILNKCQNLIECTDEEHRFNRRTEFKIVSGPKSIKIEKKRLKGTKEEGVIINETPLIKQATKKEDTKTTPAPAKKTEPAKASPATPKKETTVTKAPAKKKAKELLKFDAMSHFYGVIPHGDKRAFTYNFTNVSDENVEIDLVNGCDCMTIDWTKGVIKPGGKGYVKALMNTESKSPGDDVQDNLNVILTNINPETKSNVIIQLGYTAKVKEKAESKPAKKK